MEDFQTTLRSGRLAKTKVELMWHPCLTHVGDPAYCFSANLEVDLKLSMLERRRMPDIDRDQVRDDGISHFEGRARPIPVRRESLFLYGQRGLRKCVGQP